MEIAAQQHIRSSYKQTDLGLIPEEWDVRRIDSLLDDRTILGHLDGNHGELYPRSSEFKEHGVPYIGANDFEEGFVTFTRCKYLSTERARQFRKGVAKNGDVLFAHNATVGPVALLRTEYEFVILSTTATYFRCNEDKLNAVYLKYALQSPLFVKQYKAVMAQSTRFQVPITAQRKFSLVIPPVPEQRAIAVALSDVDELISTLKELIAKKRDLKQAAMQQLLTGKRRLPGFIGEWEVKRLGEVCSIKTGTKDVNEGNPSGVYPFFTCSRESTFSDQYSFDGEAILVAGNGEVGNLHRYKGKFEAYQRTYVLQDFALDISYLWHQLDFFFKKSLGIGTIGSSIPYIKRENIADFTFSAPAGEVERSAISTILSDMDVEIAALEKRCDKTRDLKQGMMQELLTGKTRLI